MDIDIVVGALEVVRWGRRLIDGDGGEQYYILFSTFRMRLRPISSPGEAYARLLRLSFLESVGLNYSMTWISRFTSLYTT